MDGLIKDIESLPVRMQEAIKRDIESKVEDAAFLYKETCETDAEYIEYLNEKIQLASKNIDDLLVETKNDKIEIYWEQISRLYVFFKEGKKALIKMRDDCLRQSKQLLANGSKCNQLPKELDNEQARLIFAKAVEAGLMDDNYNWIGTKRLLACFCREMSIKLGLGKGEANGKPMLSWKPFEKLFGMNNIRGAFNDFQREGQDPIGIEIIDEIFK